LKGLNISLAVTSYQSRCLFFIRSDGNGRNLIIRTGLCVSGIVQYNAIPVSGIRVEAWSEATGGWDVDISKGTLTNGANYKISGLPPGEYHVNVYPLNYQDDYYRVELTNSDIQNLHFPFWAA
jgi:hypothetical protein